MTSDSRSRAMRMWDTMRIAGGSKVRGEDARTEDSRGQEQPSEVAVRTARRRSGFRRPPVRCKFGRWPEPNDGVGDLMDTILQGLRTPREPCARFRIRLKGWRRFLIDGTSGDHPGGKLHVGRFPLGIRERVILQAGRFGDPVAVGERRPATGPMHVRILEDGHWVEAGSFDSLYRKFRFSFQTAGKPVLTAFSPSGTPCGHLVSPPLKEEIPAQLAFMPMRFMMTSADQDETMGALVVRPRMSLFRAYAAELHLDRPLDRSQTLFWLVGTAWIFRMLHET